MNKLLFIIIAAFIAAVFVMSSFYYPGANNKCPLCFSNVKHLKFLVSAVTGLITAMVSLCILDHSGLETFKDVPVSYFSGRAPP